MPHNLFVQFVCPSTKVLNFNEKRLHWASIVRVRSNLHLLSPFCWGFSCCEPQYESSHTTHSWNIKWQKCEGISDLWVLNEIIQKKNPENMKRKSWKPFGSYLLNSTANPAYFHPNLARLAVLFSRQLLNGSQDFFFILIF